MDQDPNGPMRINRGPQIGDMETEERAGQDPDTRRRPPPWAQKSKLEVRFPPIPTAPNRSLAEVFRADELVLLTHDNAGRGQVQISRLHLHAVPLAGTNPDPMRPRSKPSCW